MKLAFAILLPLAAALWVPPQSHPQLGKRADTTSSVKRSKVIILGGGISGIAAARSLTNDHGIKDFVMLEARDELGGRAHTGALKDSTGGSVQVEIGCNWIQGPGREPIQELADKWGLKTANSNFSDMIWFEGGDNGNGHWVSDAELAELAAPYDAAMEKAIAYAPVRKANGLIDITVRAATTMMGWVPTTAMQRTYEYFNIDALFAQTPEECSFYDTLAYEHGGDSTESAPVPDKFVIDQRGFKYLFVQEARQIFGQNLDDARLHLKTTVKSIDWSGAAQGGDIVVTTTDGQTFAAPQVLSTFSLGVLQHQDVSWVPELPSWKMEAISTMGMAIYQKIFLMFDKQFWGPSQFSTFVDPRERGRYILWQNVNADGFFPQGTNQNVIMVTATTHMATRNEEFSDDAIKAEAVEVLREMYGPDVPEPVDIIVPRWGQDPLYRGSYSNAQIGGTTEHHINLGKPVGSNNTWLHFSGEATSLDATGYVQGAWTTGIDAANAVAQCLKGKCPKFEAYEEIKSCKQKPTQLQKRAAPARRLGSI